MAPRPRRPSRPSPSVSRSWSATTARGSGVPRQLLLPNCRRLVLPVHLLCLPLLLGCIGPTAGDVKLEDDGVVHHPVDGRGGGHGVGKDALPLREDQVWGDAEGLPLVAGRERDRLPRAPRPDPAHQRPEQNPPVGIALGTRPRLSDRAGTSTDSHTRRFRLASNWSISSNIDTSTTHSTPRPG